MLFAEESTQAKIKSPTLRTTHSMGVPIHKWHIHNSKRVFVFLLLICLQLERFIPRKNSFENKLLTFFCITVLYFFVTP